MSVTAAVADEVERAKRKFPTWPTDPLHAVAVLGEEFGELTKAIVQHIYEPHRTTADEVRTEAIQTAAMAMRFLESFERYDFAACPQHEQSVAPLVAPSVDTNAERQRDGFDIAREVMFDASERRAADAPQEPTCAQCGNIEGANDNAVNFHEWQYGHAFESSVLPSKSSKEGEKRS